MTGEQRSAAPPPPSRGMNGKHIAIAAIAAFALLLLFVLFYRGDRPTDQPLEMSAEEIAAAARPEPAPPADLSDAEAPVTDNPELQEQPTGLRPDPRTDSDEEMRGQREPSARGPQKGPPKTNLDRPELELGGKPAEMTMAGQASARQPAQGMPISADEIRRVVGENERAVKTCFEKLTRSQKIIVALKVVPSGAVAEASVKNPLPTEESDCIENNAKTWRFKAPGGEQAQDVNVPFVLISGTG